MARSNTSTTGADDPTVIERAGVSRIDRSVNRALARISGAPLREGNTLQLLRNGPETFDDWLAAIARARRWVHLENYIFKADTIGQRFADALIERAAAGVPVRVLYDWFGSADVPSAFWEQLRENGVEVRVVNPPGIGAPLRAINRDHRKFVGVDGVYASTGGVCIADPWLHRSPVTGLPYRDTAVRVSGPVVADLEAAFSRAWDSTGGPLHVREIPPPTALAEAGSIAARVVASEPGRMRMLWLLQTILAGAARRVWIADAYFLAMPSLREALMTAARDGVDVRLLLPATNDLPIVGALSRSGYRPLLEAGVRIWEYSGLMMHAKTTVADGWWSRVGSTNLNVTGLLTNWELDLMVEDAGFGAAMEAMYEDDLANAREIRLAPSRKRALPKPARPQSRAEQRARKDQLQGGSAPAMVAVARASAALQAATSDQLRQHERTVGGAIGAMVLSLSLLIARFPRLLAWPLSLIGSLFGGVTLVRALRPSEPTTPPPSPLPRGRFAHPAHRRTRPKHPARRFKGRRARR